MTSPRDALRALEQKWREPMTYVDESLDARAIAFTLRICADELSAIVSQMDSEPTVAQCVCPLFNCPVHTFQPIPVTTDLNAELRQQLATAEKTIAELRERVEAAEIRAEAAEACHVESSDIDEDTINYLRDRVLAAERTCEELKAKCGELFAREQALRDEMVRARTTVKS